MVPRSVCAIRPPSGQVYNIVLRLVSSELQSINNMIIFAHCDLFFDEAKFQISIREVCGSMVYCVSTEKRCALFYRHEIHGMYTVSYELETADMVPSTNRVTLRLPNEVLNVLKKEAQRKDLPLNALLTKFLYKIVSFDMNIQAMPTIMIHEFLFSKMFDDLNESKLEKIASEGPRIVKKLFAILGLRYDLDQVISNYFETTGKYCRWYTFKQEVRYNHYRLVFETQLGQ